MNLFNVEMLNVFSNNILTTKMLSVVDLKEVFVEIKSETSEVLDANAVNNAIKNYDIPIQYWGFDEQKLWCEELLFQVTHGQRSSITQKEFIKAVDRFSTFRSIATEVFEDILTRKELEYDADTRKKAIRGCRKRLEDEFPDFETGIDEDGCITLPSSAIKQGSMGVEIGSASESSINSSCYCTRACTLM